MNLSGLLSPRAFFQVKFSNSGDIIYAVGLEKESDDDGETYDSSFKTFDASDYSSIATIETKYVY